MTEGDTPSAERAASTAMNAIAVETCASIDLVKALYEEEVAGLIAQAKVKQFVGVIATRRVKQQLRSLQRGGT